MYIFTSLSYATILTVTTWHSILSGTPIDLSLLLEFSDAWLIDTPVCIVCVHVGSHMCLYM